MKRVVVTGMGGISSLGCTWKDIKAKMQNNDTGTRFMHEWADIDHMNTRLAAPIDGISLDGRWPRKFTRSMGTVSLYSLYATESALKMAMLENNPVIRSNRTGIAYGSSYGSTQPLADFAELLFNRNLKNITATSYIRMMSHTCAVNLSLFLGIQGRIIPTSVACSSGSLAIGYAYEAIKNGYQEVMIAGGAEELCPSMAAVFDTLFATSVKNDAPKTTPAPFDAHRDGLVVGEGASTLILEEYEHALHRGAPIYAEVVGFSTNMDGKHVTQPTQDTIEIAIKSALANAQIHSDQIDIINGHGTATEFGDITESLATYSIFGDRTPYHVLKGHFGHTLGACGALEAWLLIEMMNDNWFVPIANLNTIDERCASLNYIKNKPLELQTLYGMTNNFAFGGINTSLIFKKFK